MNFIGANTESTVERWTQQIWELSYGCVLSRQRGDDATKSVLDDQQANTSYVLSGT